MDETIAAMVPTKATSTLVKNHHSVVQMNNGLVLVLVNVVLI